jgi:hypothetical protein
VGLPSERERFNLCCRMVRAVLCTLVTALALTGFAAAATSGFQPYHWSLKDMRTAIRAVGYPTPHAKKLVCTESGVPVGSGGRYSSFRCTATYSQHRSKFVVAGVGEGGWICGGRTFSGCKLLRHGFVTTGAVDAGGSMAAMADLASRGYLAVHDQLPYRPVRSCKKSGSSTWSCAFTVNKARVTVSLSFKRASGGYVVGGTTS